MGDGRAARTFRVDRIAGKPAAGRRFLPRRIPCGDAADYVSRSLSIDPYPIRARIVLQAPLERMAELIPRSAGRLERIDDGRCLLEAGAQAHHILVVTTWRSTCPLRTPLCGTARRTNPRQSPLAARSHIPPLSGRTSRNRG
jgi:hypothetical protein